MFSINPVLFLNRACLIQKAHHSKEGIDNEKKVSPKWDFPSVLGFVRRQYVLQSELQPLEVVAGNSNSVSGSNIVLSFMSLSGTLFLSF